jgi:hypothetical protein
MAIENQLGVECRGVGARRCARLQQEAVPGLSMPHVLGPTPLNSRRDANMRRIVRKGGERVDSSPRRVFTN